MAGLRRREGKCGEKRLMLGQKWKWRTSPEYPEYCIQIHTSTLVIDNATNLNWIPKTAMGHTQTTLALIPSTLINFFFLSPSYLLRHPHSTLHIVCRRLKRPARAALVPSTMYTLYKSHSLIRFNEIPQSPSLHCSFPIVPHPALDRDLSEYPFPFLSFLLPPSPFLFPPF